jgi:hypothetical protein
MGGIVPNFINPFSGTPAPPPPPSPVTPKADAPTPASAARRRRKTAEGRTLGASTSGGDAEFATKTLLGS